MSDLAGFLAARLDEDEADLRVSDDRPQRIQRGIREADAKRKIIAEWEDQRKLSEQPGGNLNDYHGNYEAGVEYAIMCLAAVYQDHPDYREDWRP